MSKQSSASKIKLNGFNDLFGMTDSDNLKTDVRDVMLDDLYPFEGHPFKVQDDARMEELVASIKEHGVLVPGIARIRSKGGYEIIAGHSRKRACELAGLTTIPIVEMSCSNPFNDRYAACTGMITLSVAARALIVIKLKLGGQSIIMKS